MTLALAEAARNTRNAAVKFPKITAVKLQQLRKAVLVYRNNIRLYKDSLFSFFQNAKYALYQYPAAQCALFSRIGVVGGNFVIIFLSRKSYGIKIRSTR